MKFSRRQVRQKAHAIPRVRFEDQQLTSYSGLLLLQVLFSRLSLRDRLRRCFKNGGAIYPRAQLMLGLIVHFLLGHRELREARYYRDDPMVERILGLSRLPDVATLSGFLSESTPRAVDRLRRLLRNLVLERLHALRLWRITFDIDGSVLRTGRWAEGTSVGFNRKKRGQRSYYPLFATLAQTGQVFDILHRPGNVHDSRRAREFMAECIESIRAALPGVVIEVHADGAFFSDAIVSGLKRLGVELTLSVPFLRFVELKATVERRRKWRQLDGTISFFELNWKPKVWPRRMRLLVLRTQRLERERGPIQLDLFVPRVRGYEFSVIVTNKGASARKVVRFHHGRGAQEGVFGELKSQGHLDYVPSRTLAGNQTYLLAVLLSYNLNREVQMRTTDRHPSTTERLSTLWSFMQLRTFRGALLQQAGRFT